MCANLASHGSGSRRFSCSTRAQRPEAFGNEKGFALGLMVCGLADKLEPIPGEFVEVDRPQTGATGQSDGCRSGKPDTENCSWCPIRRSGAAALSPPGHRPADACPRCGRETPSRAQHPPCGFRLVRDIRDAKPSAAIPWLPCPWRPRIDSSEKFSAPAMMRMADDLFQPSGPSSTTITSYLQPGWRTRRTAAIICLRTATLFSSLSSAAR